MNGSDLFQKFACREPFNRLHPLLAQFFRDYLSQEKAVKFGGRFVINTHFPPYPGGAFDRLADHFETLGDPANRTLYSVTLGVTNRCHYHCWHCYNAGRSQRDMPFADIKKIVNEVKEMGGVMITLSGGEPLLRDDLEDIAGLFDDRSCLMLNTTGSGLSAKRARALKKAGLFAAGISLDSMDVEAHDRMRGKPGAFRTALRALKNAADAGLYPYIVTVAGRDLLKPDNFMEFLEFAGASGAREVHLLEPCPAGRLSGRNDIGLNSADRGRIKRYQADVSLREDLPSLSTFTYLESPGAFGCGAGLTYLYIDGSGEVCPCNLVPLSFGNAAREPLSQILDRMGEFFMRPRTSCAGHLVAGHIPDGPMPVAREISERLCREHLPQDPKTPRFFTVKERAGSNVGTKELRAAYNSISRDYDSYWLSEAGRPVLKLVRMIASLDPCPRKVFEAGCGTGFATAALAQKLGPGCHISGTDLSRGMIRLAKERIHPPRRRNIDFYVGDALEMLGRMGPVDLIFSSWVLGYIPLDDFFRTARESLEPTGRIAFIVHRQNSPKRELGIFYELVAQDPSILTKKVYFDFPRDTGHIERLLRQNSFIPERITGGRVIFRCDSPGDVLTHLLKSGAGTAFYDAVKADARPDMEGRFKAKLAARANGAYDVVHDYIMCIARTDDRREALKI